MKIFTFRYFSEIKRPREEVLSWHLRKGAMERLTPARTKVVVLFSEGHPMLEGSQVGVKICIGPFRIRWIVRHVDCKPGQEFADEQTKGPFSYWKHIHRFRDMNGGCVMEDEISYAVPLPFLQSIIHSRLERIFTCRHETLKHDLDLIAKHPTVPLKILVTGSGGMVGRALCSFLTAAGHEIKRLVRQGPAGESTLVWEPTTGEVPICELEALDAVIHLAGENIAAKSWTKSRKRKIFQSRCRDTWLLSEALSRLKSPPKVFISASAVGIYGNRPGEELTEESLLGAGFLADVCKRWEEASCAIRDKGCRVAHLRFGYILSARGGMLAKILPVFQWGLGGKLGNGTQVMPWVSLDDVIGAIYHVLNTVELKGAVNVTAPHPLLQRDFAAALAKHLKRPAIARVPKFFLKLALGERADALLFTSAFVLPKRLLETGYAFRYPTLDSALSHEL